MKISDEPSIITQRACLPRIKDGENVLGDGRSVQYGKAKFKSAVVSLRVSDSFQANLSSEQMVIEDCSGARTSMSEKIVSNFEACSSNGVRKRVFGADASNIQFPLEGRNNAHADDKTATNSCEYQGNGMPGFGGILDDIYPIRPDVDVRVQHSDGSSDQRKTATLQSACRAQEANDTRTSEKNTDSEEDQANPALQEKTTRLGAGGCRSLRAAVKYSTNSQFKMPARVISSCKAPASETYQDVPGTLARRHRFHPPYLSTKTPPISVNAEENRWKVEKVLSDYYCVMYCTRKPNAKHKGPWSDGVLIRQGRSSTLQDIEGKVVSKDGEQRNGALPEGATLFMGKFEVEVMRRSTEEEFLSGRIFLGEVDVPCEAIVKVIQKPAFKCFQAPPRKQSRESIDAELITPREAQVAEGKPALGKDEVVLNASYLRGAGIPVTVDPYLALKLRPHQLEGVQFMYECIMGLRNSDFTGCLLADAMGLGKTLQVIALIWTLIKQGPGGHPAVQRVLVICPSSLVENWGKEVRKWLGNERLSPLIIHSGTSANDVKRKLSNFQVGKVYQLLITSYELLRKHKDDLKSAKPGLLVCDEAHRLKNCAGNKTIDSLVELKSPRRLILTGTPVQNDLLEFYAMIDFVNPTLLGPLSTFKRLFANPIERSRDRDASEGEKILGRARSAELQSMTRFCILQRTANVNAKYLPAKTEFVVFCKLQPLQVSLYQSFLQSKLVSESLASGKAAFVLSAIGTLRKLCNHPRLVEHELSKGKGNSNGESCRNRGDLKASDRLQDRTPADWRLSGKLSCLKKLLSVVHDSSCTRDKMVVVSNFTQTLDIIQMVCEGQGWRWLRLDGTTDVSERQALVDRFNTNPEERVFLLSSKAGGSGLNLIGANRLVLFDPDWNPATDAQAMARIWRDGQKKVVFIYRLLTTASIEEKIYQRQIMKGEVAAAVEDQNEEQFSSADGGGRRHFSREELRELFTLDLETICDTYDLLSRSESSEHWRDYSKEVEDHVLKEAIQTGVVTFVYQNIFKNEIILDNVHDAVGSKLGNQIGGLDNNQTDFSSISSDLVDEPLLDHGQQSTNPTRGSVNSSITCLDHDAEVNGGAKICIPPVGYDIMGKQTNDLSLQCDEHISNSIHIEDESITTHLESECPAAKDSISILSKEKTHTQEILNVKKRDHFVQEINGVLQLEYGEQISNPIHNKHKRVTLLSANHSNWRLAKSNNNAEDKRDARKLDVDPYIHLADFSPTPIHIAREESDHLLESQCQTIMKLLVDLPAPDDELGIDELELLDAPFLCSLDLEMEMNKANFAAEDLWQGFKLFAIGFLLGEKEEWLSYRNSKLGLILEKCNLDKTTDDESIFCKGLPLVRAVLNRRDGYQAADVSYLFNHYEREEDLITTSTGRFVIQLMKLIDRRTLP